MWPQHPVEASSVRRVDRALLMSFFEQEGDVDQTDMPGRAERELEKLLADLAVFADVDHHLWWNRRTRWVAFTVIRDGYRQERVRLSLGTTDAATARRRRDNLLREWAMKGDVTLSLRLRYPHPRRKAA